MTLCRGISTHQWFNSCLSVHETRNLSKSKKMIIQTILSWSRPTTTSTKSQLMASILKKIKGRSHHQTLNLEIRARAKSEKTNTATIYRQSLFIGRHFQAPTTSKITTLVNRSRRLIQNIQNRIMSNKHSPHMQKSIQL